VSTTESTAGITVQLQAPSGPTKRVYRVCLAHRSSGSPPGCQVIAVAGAYLWNGTWTQGDLLHLVATQQGAAPAITLSIIQHDTAPAGSLTSPFLFEVPGSEGIWFEWVSPEQVVVNWPSLNGGVPFPRTLTRVP
jgi:hypothetical protein